MTDELLPRPDPTLLTTEQLLREVASLRDHVDTMFRERHALYAGRFDAQEKAMETAYTAAETAVKAAFESSEKAILKAEISIEKRADATYVALTELQRMLSNLMPREEAVARLANIEKVSNANGSRIDRLEANKAGGKETLAGLYALAGFLASLLVIGGILAAAGVFGK